MSSPDSSPTPTTAPYDPAEGAAAGLHAFDQVVAASTGFRSRAGQRGMAEKVAQTLAAATLGKVDEDTDPVRAIAVIQAGTGVGKSLAYCAPAIALALARNTRVLISTATVALQEQLVAKDLPALAASMPQPFRFALAKGRGRYVCRLKLERLGGLAEPEIDEEDPEDDLFADELPAMRSARETRPAHEVEARLKFYAGVAQALSSGAWDGDRDTLETPPTADVWLPMAAEAASCTGKHCPSFGQCAYYERRKTLVGAQVIVVNHDLLLSSLGNRLLPELDNSLLVLDEAHHLPATALAQFACRMDLGRHGWAEKLARRAVRFGSLLGVTEVADIPVHAKFMRQALQDVERLATDLYGETLRAGLQGAGRGASRARLPRGALDEALVEPLGQVAHHAEGFLTAMRCIAKALRAEMRERPEQARRLSTQYAQLGALAPRLESVAETAQLLLRDTEPGQVPTAKWFTLDLDGDQQPVLQAHASPLLPGATLRNRLWGAVRGAVLTSATLTSMGKFEFFLREAGLHDDEAASTLEVPSPFDYARQGRLIAVETRADPRDAAEYVAEMVRALVHDLQSVRSGALVLFTSREQLRQAVTALPPVLVPRVLVQTAMPRGQLLAAHRARVADGAPSIIFGMQSFGEGLDLPGRLCESVFITKLPFAPPDDPVGEARAEWLRGSGRDPFTELVVPATAIRLAQWVGRAIRTEEDRAAVYCYDRRLVTTAYGQRLLQGLPAFAFSRGRREEPEPVAG
ncbi:ATP-dependent DNA helicase DinG [Xylophilus sp. GOD-11R]|uniref:ATP-dependent DNA helicase DinG n=1 Tax=Xylophilus sp. GOD-11R TaxID=3089814 RepID=UPI00298CD6BC|nr:ATP-dependent DNA helicase DinG [Xylophilus sp. GOD-11R]WPB57198.1 ATP-dependent DNA helicase DinG [Xylophilus sp. GOD-11R]